MAKHDKKTEQKLDQLGARIKALRIAAGYTNYEKFSYEHDISRSQFGRYENGQDMKFSSLLKVLDALGIPLAEFFGEGFETSEPEAEDPC